MSTMLLVGLLFVSLPFASARYEVNLRKLGYYDDAKSWAQERHDDVISKFNDKYESTSEWADGTSARAKQSAQDSNKRVAAHRDQLNAKMGNAYNAGGNASIEASKDAFQDAFPTCMELGYVIRVRFNETLDSKLEEIFAVQACTKNISSAACKTFIEDVIVSLIFEACWFPVKKGLGDVSVAGVPVSSGVILNQVKPKVKAYFRPYILVAARPGAIMIHHELSQSNINLTDAHAGLTAAKSACQSMKNEMLRATEGSTGDLCNAMGLPSTTATEGSASEARPLLALQGSSLLLLLCLSMRAFHSTDEEEDERCSC